MDGQGSKHIILFLLLLLCLCIVGDGRSIQGRTISNILFASGISIIPLGKAVLEAKTVSIARRSFVSVYTYLAGYHFGLDVFSLRILSSIQPIMEDHLFQIWC
jgi:hypothetical protein